MIFNTTIKAIDPISGDIKTYGGPHIEAISFGMAKQYLQNNGLGYCEIEGELLAHGYYDQSGNRVTTSDYKYLKN